MTATSEVLTALPVPPGPRLPVPIQSMLFARYRHRWLPRLRRRYGDTFSVRIAPHARHLVILGRAEDIKTVFAGPAKVLHAGEGNAILGPIMGDHSVLLLDEAEHLRVRRLLMPAFHGAPLRGYRDLITDLTRAEIERWPLGTSLRIHDRMRALTLEIILQVVFGVTDERRLLELRPVVEQVLDVSPLTMLGWFYPRLRRFWPWRRFTEIQQSLDRLLYAEIAERRAAPDLATRTDVLSQLLRLSLEPADSTGRPAGLTDQELRDNLITLLLAGHETTATALAWAFHELARSPEVLAQAQHAADAGDGDYLEAVAKESMRLHPVIYEVARRLTEPFEVGGYLIPAGATIMPGIGLVQSDSEHHRDPDRFDPRRFVQTQPPANTWIPFGGGVRRCLGAGFSLLEATVVLGEVLARFELSADRDRPEPPKARNITLPPGRGARLRLTPRDRPVAPAQD
ncbi:MAG: cytochrome P450 [Jatrophihabitans sp.]